MYASCIFSCFIHRSDEDGAGPSTGPATEKPIMAYVQYVDNKAFIPDTNEAEDTIKVAPNKKEDDYLTQTLSTYL